MNDFQQRRISARLSQAKLAELVGCNQATISRIEMGKPVNQAVLRLTREVLDRVCSVHKEPGDPFPVMQAESVAEQMATDYAPPACDDASPHYSDYPAEITELESLRRRVASLEREREDLQKTILNLSDALAAGLGRASARHSTIASVARNVRSGGSELTA